jgi:hypothetical protein
MAVIKMSRLSEDPFNEAAKKVCSEHGLVDFCNQKIFPVIDVIVQNSQLNEKELCGKQYLGLCDPQQRLEQRRNIEDIL